LFHQDDLLAFTLANPTYADKITHQLKWGCIYLEDTGILRIEPKQTTTISVVLSAGVHGNETAPLELLNNIVREILQGRLVCRVRLLIIFGNPPASNLKQRFTDINMNRLFSGAWKEASGWEAQRAAQIENTISDFFALQATTQKLHYDLHTAIRGSKYTKFAVHPFIDEAIYDRQQLAFLTAADIEAVLLSHQPTTTLSYYSYKTHGAHAFTLELGRVADFGKNDLSQLTSIDNALKILISDSRLLEEKANSLQIFQVIDVLTKDEEDYRLNIADDTPNFTSFTKGDCLAQSSRSSYLIEADGDALVFPNTKLPVGQRSGLVVRKVPLELLTFNKNNN